MVEAARSEVRLNGELLSPRNAPIIFKLRLGGLFAAVIASAMEHNPPSPEKQQPESLGRRACDIVPEPVEWLWRGRIPRGKLTMLEGDPGTNKSTLAVDIAARISVGRDFPDESSCQVGRVIILAAEDGAADTLVPRLTAAEADLTNVWIVPAVDQDDDDSLRILTLPDHIKAVESTIISSKAVLAIIDPLNSFLSPKVDSHRDQDVRRVLAELGAMAERTKCAILMIRHLNKQANLAKAMYRGNGSIGLLAACRAGFLVASEDGNENVRLLACIKSNLATRPPTLRFAIKSVRPECMNKNVDEVPIIEWLGTSKLNADQLLEDASGTQLQTAKDFLLEILANGPRESRAIDDLANARQIAPGTLKRARKILRDEKRIRSAKTGGTWTVRLIGVPSETGVDQATAATPPVDTVGPHETLDPVDPLTSSQPRGLPPDASQEVQESQEVQGDQQSPRDTVAS